MDIQGKTTRDYWIEMAIREIWTQCHFAEISYKNIHSKLKQSTDLVFSSIHSFLSHCANVSKLLRSKDDLDKTITIGSILKVKESSTIHNTIFRNHLEHYDERLKRWIERYARGANVGTYNVGPKDVFKSQNMILVSHYDPTTDTFIFIDEEIKLTDLFDEIKIIKNQANEWVNSLVGFSVFPTSDN